MVTKRLRGMTWEHERGYGSVVASALAYARVRPEVQVDWEYRSLQAFADQPLEAMVREYDLLVIDHPHIPHAAEAGLLAKLDGMGHDDDLKTLATQSVGLSHVSYSHNGHQFGLASDAAAQVAAYRPDLIDQAPQTWDEVFALAEKGRVLWPYKPVDSWSSLITIASGNGEEPMRKPGLFLSTAALEEAMEHLQRLANFVPENNQYWNPIEAADCLSQGNEFAYCPLLFGYTNYSRAGYRSHKLVYTDIPESRNGVRGSLLGGAGVTVSALSQNLQEAVDYAFWLSSAEVQEGVYFDGGGQPGNAVAWESERTNALCENFFKNTRKTLEGAYLRPRFVNYIDLQNALSPLITETLRGKMTVSNLEQELNHGVERWLSL